VASHDLQANLLKTMIRIRALEERVRDLFAAGRLPGFVHLSIGQEAVAAGARALPRATAGFCWGALPTSGCGKIAKKDVRRLLTDRGEAKGVATS
jgi:hypothetical protein